MLRLTLAISMALWGAAVHAQNSPDSTADTAASTHDAPLVPHAYTFDPLQVVAQRLFPYQEGMVMDAGYIHDQVRGNGDLATLLRINPAVQFADSAATSSQQLGEIRPGEISINGGLYYQNLFQLDGTSFNNDLDPAATFSPNNPEDIPSFGQGIALDTDLIGQLTVYDSNVPASFGGFNGGVIDAESRKARADFGGKLSLRMARSAWDRRKLPADEADGYDLSSSYENQPRYDKYKASLMLEGRTEHGLGLIGTLTRTRSDIPLRAYNNGQVSSDDALVKEQRRENTSASLRADWSDDDGIELSASVTYAPTDERYFINNLKNSYFDLKSGGPVASIRAAIAHGAWTFRNTFSYSDMQSSRSVDSDIDYMKLWLRSPQFPWGVNDGSNEGNYGNVDQTTRNIGYKLAVERDAWRWGASEHRMQVGLEFSERRASYERLNDHYYYISPRATDSCVGPDGVADSETCSLSPTDSSGHGQYFSAMQLYRAGAFEVRMRQWAAFAQDDIRIGRVSLRPGLRLDGDDLMEKKTLSPRLSTSWDLFGDQRSLLTAGINRYYGRNFFGYKLREGRENLKTSYARSAVDQPWTFSRQYTTGNRFESLDIPYSDELSLGFNQRWGDWDVTAKYVRREGRDEILRVQVPSDDDSGYYSARVYQYSNDGRSSADTYSLSIAPRAPWRWHGISTTLQFAFDKTDVRRADLSYDSTYTESEYNRPVRYTGAVIPAYDLPQRGFNRPWSMRIASTTRFERIGLLWSNFLRYRAGYRSIIGDGSELYDGELIDVYKDHDYAPSFSWDSALEYEFGLGATRQAYARVEIQNVLNRTNEFASSSGSTLYYESGRSFWLELGYRF